MEISIQGQRVALVTQSEAEESALQAFDYLTVAEVITTTGAHGRVERHREYPLAQESMVRQAVSSILAASNEVKKASYYNDHPSGIEACVLTRHLPHALASAIEYVWRLGKKGSDVDALRDGQKAVYWLGVFVDQMREHKLAYLSVLGWIQTMRDQQIAAWARVQATEPELSPLSILAHANLMVIGMAAPSSWIPMRASPALGDDVMASMAKLSEIIDGDYVQLTGIFEQALRELQVALTRPLVRER